MLQLLPVCVGLPSEAHAVLQQTDLQQPLEGVSGTTLLDTGLRAPQLRALGIDPAAVKALDFDRHADFEKFGF